MKKAFKAITGYLGKNVWVGILVVIILFFSGYAIVRTRTPEPNSYDEEELATNTKGITYNVSTFAEQGVILSHITVNNGLDLSVEQLGNLSGGRRAQYPTVLINAYGRELQVSGSLVVAYPKDDTEDVVQKYLEKHDGQYPKPNEKPFGTILVSGQSKYMQKHGKLLLIKTYGGMPVAGFFGNNIKPYYTNIESSQVFDIDGSLVFVTRGWFSINDAYLFTKK